MDTKRNWLKRIIALVLCAFISIAYLPGMAYALDDQPEENPEVEENLDAGLDSADQKNLVSPGRIQITPSEPLQDPDALLQGYLDSRLDEELGIAPADSGMRKAAQAKRKNNLNANEVYIYDQLRDIIYEIASGERNNSWFGIDVLEIFKDYLVEDGIYRTVTSESLGINSPVYEKFWYGDGEDEYYWDFSDEAKAKLFDFDKVFNALMADEPYAFYWYDKTEGLEYYLDLLIDDSGEGSDISFEVDPVIDLNMAVSAAYRPDASSASYRVNTEATAAASQTVSKAEAIINENASLPDVDKLTAYKDSICGLTSYNEKVSEDSEYPYGDPWQMIYVFDEDPSTNVVCEGYSKAFQYLCDHSDFRNGIECDSVTGTLYGDDAAGAGDHMWNILHMDDGRNYIADITNCDEGNIGDGGGLFISPAMEGGRVDSSYQYDVDGDKAADITFAYDDYTRSLFSESELAMSTLPYGESTEPDIVEYDMERNRDMLPGWEGDIDGRRGVHIRKADQQDIWDEYEVLDVEVTRGGNLLEYIRRDSDEDNPDNYWWHYDIKDANELGDTRGTVTFKVTYKDIDGNEADYTFDVNVGNDVYESWFHPADGSYKALPGGSIELVGEGVHRYCVFEKNEDDPYDQGHWEQYEDREGIVYSWKIENGEEFADLTVNSSDPSRATLKFKMPDDPEDYWGDTLVSISVGPSSDQLIRGEAKGFNVSGEYYEIRPAKVSEDLDVGDSETVDFELRHYMFGKASEVVDDTADVKYIYHGDDRVTAVQDKSDGSKFTFTRNSMDNIEFDIEARWNEGSESREEWANYGYNGKNYDVWFEHNGDQVYTDGTLDYVLIIDNLGDNWADRMDIVFTVGQRVHNDETGEDTWNKIFDNNNQYTIKDGHIVRLNGSKLKDEGHVDIHAEVRLKGTDIVLSEEDAWAEVMEAWEEHDFPGYYDDNEGVFKQETSLLRGWDEYIDTHIGYRGGNGENLSYGGEFLVSSVKVISGDTVVVEKDDEGEGWSLRAVKEGDSTVRIEFTDPSGLAQMKSPYDLTVHVVPDIFDVSIDSTDGKFRVGPGESINLRAFALHKYTVDEGNDWRYEEDQEGLSYEWVLEDASLASLVQDPDDPAKAVLKFKTADELGSRRDGTRVIVKVKYKGEVVNETFDYYAVLDEYAWIQPRTIDSNIDYKDTIEVDLETWFKEKDEDARKIPGEIRYTWYFNEGDVIIEEGTPKENGEGYDFEKIWSNNTTEASHFKITRRNVGYSRIILMAEWGMGQNLFHAYYFDPKSYDIRMTGYDDKMPSIKEGESKTFNYTVSGFSADATFDASISIWDDERSDWVNVDGLPDGAVTTATSEGGLAVTLSENLAGALLDKNINKFNISVCAYKNGNAIWVEDGRPINVRKADWEPRLEALANNGKYYGADDVLYLEPGSKAFVTFLSNGDENLDYGFAPIVGFNEPSDENGDPIIEDGKPIGDLSKAGFKIKNGTAGSLGYSGQAEEITNDTYGVEIDTAQLPAGTTADLSYYLYAYEGDDFWDYFNSDEFSWDALTIAKTQKLTVKVGSDPASLENAKTAAKSELDSYKNAADYRPAQQTELANAIAAGKAEIDAATDEAGVASALASAKTAIDAIKTDAQMAAEEAVALETAKTAARADLDSYKRATDYRPAQQTELANAIAAGKAEIDAATNEAGVASALASAKATIDEIKTAAQMDEEEAAALTAAKTAANDELDSIDTGAYSGSEKTNVENAIANGKAAIEAATTVADVNAAKTAALNTINAQKTDAQKNAEAAAVTPVAPPAPVEIIDLPTVKISKPAAAKKKITVKWKKVSKKNLKKISGIQIQVATDPDFTNIVKTATAGKKKTSKVIKGLQSKTKYYVRIRAYAPDNHYSVWKSKSAKVK